jgi:hypothetical protein
MNRVFVPAALVCGLMASTSAYAQQQRFSIPYTGALTTFTAPLNGSYEIIAYGAEGGSSKNCGLGGGGRGAEIGGTFTLAAGEVLQIAVGGAGVDGARTGGGGGGTFVVTQDGRPIVVAGGGSGAGSLDGLQCLVGLGGLITPGTGNGGMGGNLLISGGGGGGFFSAGTPGAFGGGGGGGGWPSLVGGLGQGGDGINGGFGGGGGAGGRGGGGGGGFSGGNGGTGGLVGQGPGGGGGSSAGKNPLAVANLQNGNGEVVITTVPAVFAGTPGTSACQAKSTAQLTKEFGGLNAAASALGVADRFALQEDILEFCTEG